MSNKPDGTKKKNNQSQKPVAQKKPAPVKIKGAIPSFTPRVPKSPVQLTVPTVAVNELILGNVATGHNVAIGDATFGIMDSGHKLTLVTASTGELAKFSGKAPHVYITVDDLVMGKYRPRLTGKWGDQQVAMWQHICDAIGNDGLDALEKRLNRDREARRELFKAEHEATEKAAMYVGENIEVWERAVTGSDAITTAFTDMTADTAVEVRFGNLKLKDSASYSMVLGFFYDQSVDGFKIEVGHVGEKAELAGKMIIGAHLRCFGGRVPDQLSEKIMSAHFGGSVKIIHEMIIGMTSAGDRDTILNGMYHAAKRITADRKNSVLAKPALTLVGKQTTSTQTETVQPVKVADVPAVEVTTAVIEQQFTKPVETQKLADKPLTDAEIARTMREAGFTAIEVIVALRQGSGMKSA